MFGRGVSKAPSPVPIRTILLAVALAIVAGALGGMEAQLFGLRLHTAYVFVGGLFLNTLKMLIMPLEAMELIMAVDRFDMSRTAVNVFSDSAGAVAGTGQGRTEGAKTALRLAAEPWSTMSCTTLVTCRRSASSSGSRAICSRWSTWTGSASTG